MRWLYSIFGILVCGLSALSAPKDVPFVEPSAPDVAVILEGPSRLDANIALALETELGRIFGPSGTRLALVTNRDRNGHDVYDSQVIMVRVTGRCEMGPRHLTSPHKPDTLGRAFITDGVILPFVELDCTQISGAIRQRLITTSSDDRPILFGRALARVLAHEIYHVMASTMHHTSEGIAAETMSSEQMVRPKHDFRLEDFSHMGLVPAYDTH